MAITSSQSNIYESETVPKRPVMPLDIFSAAMKGDSDVLIGRLGLQTKEQTQIQEDGDSNHESTKDLPFGSELIPLIQRTSPFATKSNEDGDSNQDSTKDLPFSPKLMPLIERTPYFATKSNVTLKDSHSTPEEIRTENQTVPSELQSATRSGDTVLHLLVTKMHNELALKVFKRDPSLLKTQNKMLETPLHCAARSGNREVILMFNDFEPFVVRDALQETNEKGDTALHVAVKYNFADICRILTEVDSEVAFNVNKEMFSPLHIAIDEKHDFVAEQMLCVDPILACTQLTDGMFPVYLAARKHNWNMVLYFMKHFPDCAELVDSHGRNLCHIVAQEVNDDYLLGELLILYQDMIIRMNNATDYEGNTPLHIAAMKGHSWTMKSIWNMTNCVAETVKNKRGLTPYEVSRKQLIEKYRNEGYRLLKRICAHEQTNGEIFSEEWFIAVMRSPTPFFLRNKWDKTQVIGLGSVLITTVTFAAAFTIPGGYNQDHGTPVLGKRYMFWAFILANAFAFIQGFLSLFALFINVVPDRRDTIPFATITFMFAASSMVVAFGLGMYVTLAPVCLPIAIILLVISLFVGSPILLSGVQVWQEIVGT